MKQNIERLYNGIIKENPTFVLMLGMCPTLAVTSSAINGLGMGLSTTVVLVLSNLLISAFRKVIPNGVRVPAFIVIVASLVTMVQFMMEAYTPSLSKSLGVYIPLIVVNCIILGRAESYASKHSVVPSIFDGIGMGLGFTLGLTLIGLVREVIGSGTIFDISLAADNHMMIGGVLAAAAVILIGVSVYLAMKRGGMSALTVLGTAAGVILVIAAVVALLGPDYTAITIFVMAPGAFLVLAVLVAVMNIIRDLMEQSGKPLAKASGCLTGDCANCGQSALCTGKGQSAVANAADENKNE